MSVRVWHRRAGQKTFTWGKTLTKLQLKISRRENESKPARNRKQSWTRFFLHNRNKYTLEEPKNRDVKEKLSKHPHHHRHGNKPSPEESLKPNGGSRPHQLHVPLPRPDPTTTLYAIRPSDIPMLTGEELKIWFSPTSDDRRAIALVKEMRRKANTECCGSHGTLPTIEPCSSPR